MITEAKKAELDAVAAVRVMPVAPPQKPVTLQTLDARLTALEKHPALHPIAVYHESEEQSNG